MAFLFWLLYVSEETIGLKILEVKAYTYPAWLY